VNPLIVWVSISLASALGAGQRGAFGSLDRDGKTPERVSGSRRLQTSSTAFVQSSRQLFN
jgi:hypothetical protein